jgi:hypothetical protein
MPGLSPPVWYPEDIAFHAPEQLRYLMFGWLEGALDARFLPAVKGRAHGDAGEVGRGRR